MRDNWRLHCSLRASVQRDKLLHSINSSGFYYWCRLHLETPGNANSVRLTEHYDVDSQ